MATTYSVTNTFAADTTAVASEVNQNFTDILAALNAFDASNLSSGTVPLARIVGLTTSQFAANVVDTDGTLAANSDTRMASQKAGKTYIDTTVAAINTLTASGATVFSTTMSAGSTFQDLDLSAQVGSNLAVVWLEVDATNIGVGEVYIARPKGFGGAFNAHFTSGQQAGGTMIQGPSFGYMSLITDTSGVIQHGDSNGGVTIPVKLIAYRAA